MRFPETGPWSLGLGAVGTVVGIYLVSTGHFAGWLAFAPFMGWLIGVFIDIERRPGG